MEAKDSALLEYLINATRTGSIRWEQTATSGNFTTSFKGKYSVSIFSRPTGPFAEFVRLGLDQAAPTISVMTLSDDADQQLLELTSEDDDRIRDLHAAVRRSVLNVDSAIDEIMGGAG